MANYLKLFETISEYTENLATLLLPNVSVCKDNLSTVMYKPKTSEPVLEGNKILCTYNIEDINNDAVLFKEGYGDAIVKIEIDDVELDSVVNTYRFDTIGEHIILFTLDDENDINGLFSDDQNTINITNVIIGNSITLIDKNIFKDCSRLTSITIPNSVTTIDDYAFKNCSSLTNITIPNTVTRIGSGAFSGCSGLTSITIPNSVTTIDNYAFQDCYGLTSVTIGNLVQSIGESAFSGCSGLTSVTIPDSVTSISDSAFSGCSGLTSIIIGNNVTSIGNEAFYSCSGLTSITIPDSVTSIEYNTFENCYGLTSISVDVNNQKYDSRNNCNAIIETLTNTLITGCKNTIIPNSVTSIGAYAFYGCSGLTSIIIPDSATSIDYGAFENCSGLTNITCNATTAPTIQSSTFQNVKTEGTLIVPTGSTGYDVWMGTGNYYLGSYNWTKVEA